MDGPTDSTAGDVSVSLAIGVPATVFGCAVLVASLTTNIVVGRRTVASKKLPAAVKWLTLSLVVADLLFLLCTYHNRRRFLTGSMERLELSKTKTVIENLG